MAIKKQVFPIAAKAFFSAKAQRGNATVTFDSIDLKFTNLQKIYWPEEGYTKFDLLKYYYTIAKTILPYLKDRPLILKRYPSGIKGQMFYQHNVTDAPKFVQTFSRIDSEVKKITYVVAY